MAGLGTAKPTRVQPLQRARLPMAAWPAMASADWDRLQKFGEGASLLVWGWGRFQKPGMTSLPRSSDPNQQLRVPDGWVAVPFYAASETPVQCLRVANEQVGCWRKRDRSAHMSCWILGHVGPVPANGDHPTVGMHTFSPTCRVASVGMCRSSAANDWICGKQNCMSKSGS